MVEIVMVEWIGMIWTKVEEMRTTRACWCIHTRIKG